MSFKSLCNKAGALGLYIFPKLFAHWGMNACFVAMMAAMILAFPLHRYFANYKIERKAAVQQHDVKAKSMMGMFAIVATLLFYGAIGGIWTFMSSVADHSHIDTQFTNSVLAISTLVGIFSNVIGTFVGGRFARLKLLILGYSLFFISLFLLLNQVSQNAFAVAVFAFKFTWMFSAPFVLATVASLDYTGKLINLTNLVIGGGLAFGPIIAGKLIESTNNYNLLVTFTLILFLLSFLVIVYCNTRKSKVTQNFESLVN